MVFSDIIIMTPDVLDYLTSNWGKRKFLFDKIKLIIFDELHLIVEKKFGSTIEILISRINMLNEINNV
jgi:replicative superfamily II helicase